MKGINMRKMPVKRTTLPVLLPVLMTTLCCSMLFSACGGSGPDGCTTPGCNEPVDTESAPAADTTEKVVDLDAMWPTQAVALSVKGFQYAGDKINTVPWSGTGFWIGPGMLATNAHVVKRAVDIVGKDDANKHTFIFKEIVAYDERKDLAILKADAFNESVVSYVTLMPKPEESPRNVLRGKDVLAVGNIAGLMEYSGQGMSVVSGKISNFFSQDDYRTIIHDANIADGASGGPLYLKENGMLAGINNAINLEMRMSFSIPAWELEEMYNKAGGETARSVPISDMFIRGDIGKLVKKKALTKVGTEKICLESANDALVIPIAVVDEGQDILVVAFPEKQQSTLVFGILNQADETVYAAEFNGDSQFAFSFPQRGNYRAVIQNRTFATHCVQMATLNVEWKTMLE